MNNFTLIAISIGLAMDAFAVSLSEGIALKRQSIKYGLIVGLLFGAFQAFMPLLGWYAGSLFSEYSRIVSFILLLGIGCKMLYEAYESDLCEKKGICKLSGDLIMLGVATSIDALAIGFSFSLLQNINIFKSITVIGLITFIISFSGVCLGSKIGKHINTKAEYFGGGILILIAFKTLIF